MTIRPAVSHPLPINIITGIPGGGKTKLIIEEMARTPGRYVFSALTIEGLEEHETKLRDEARSAGTMPLILPIRSVKGVTGISIAREVTEALQQHDKGHVILMITHAALKMVNFEAHGADWHVRIDEVPDTVLSGVASIPASATYYAVTYALTPSSRNPGWHEVSLLPGGPSLSAIRLDDHVSSTAPWHRRVASGRGLVLVDVADWRDAQVPGRVVKWWSVWTLAELEACASVVVTGASAETSMTIRASQKLCTLSINTVDVSPVRTAQPGFRVSYYAERHVGSTTFWEKPEGRSCLLAVAADLADRHVGFWSGNTSVISFLEGRFPGEKVRPRAAGLNKYRGLTSCAFIYSSKPLPADAILMDVFGESRASILSQREDEDVWQFVWRGAPRNIDFGGLYEIILYDRRQAMALVERLRAAGFNDVPDPVCIVSASISEVVRPKPGPVAAVVDVETFEARAEARRIRERNRIAAKRAATKGAAA
jgi:hypothetical protein